MSSYVLNPAVDRDLDTIAEFIAADNPSAAVRLLVEFQARFELIAQNPGIGHHFASHRTCRAYVSMYMGGISSRTIRIRLR